MGDPSLPEPHYRFAFQGMRDLFFNMPSCRFHFSPEVVIFFLRDSSAASLFIKSLLPRFAKAGFVFTYMTEMSAIAKYQAKAEKLFRQDKPTISPYP
jgi:hypothetical protein